MRKGSSNQGGRNRAQGMELWTLHREALSPQHREARHNSVKDCSSVKEGKCSLAFTFRGQLVTGRDNFL